MLMKPKISRHPDCRDCYYWEHVDKLTASVCDDCRRYHNAQYEKQRRQLHGKKGFQ